MTNVFIENDIVQWTTVEEGISRTIIAHDDSVMLVQVKFEKNAIGVLHQHAHVQITYVASGVFEVELNGTKKILKQGDAFSVASLIWHGVVCLEAGVLLDTFSPCRLDFLN